MASGGYKWHPSKTAFPNKPNMPKWRYGYPKNSGPTALGKATQLAATALVGYGLGGAIGGLGSSTGSTWLSKLGTTIGNSALSGLSKRVEAQVAGPDAFRGSNTGYVLPYQAATQGALQSEMMAAQASQQSESQGQYLDFMTQQKMMDYGFQAWQAQLDRDLTREIYLFRNGDTANGQTFPYPSGENIGNAGKKIYNQSFLPEHARKFYEKGNRQSPTLDIGYVGGKHYGSTW